MNISCIPSVRDQSIYLVVVNIMILNVVQHVLVNKSVCAACRAAPAARQRRRAVHAPAMLGTDVLFGVKRCCSVFDKTRCFAGIQEGRSE